LTLSSTFEQKLPQAHQSSWLTGSFALSPLLHDFSPLFHILVLIKRLSVVLVCLERHINQQLAIVNNQHHFTAIINFSQQSTVNQQKKQHTEQMWGWGLLFCFGLLFDLFVSCLGRILQLCLCAWSVTSINRNETISTQNNLKKHSHNYNPADNKRLQHTHQSNR
jgi:hypothetical protein